MLHLLPPQAHSSVERAALIGGVMMRKVPTDSSYAVAGDALKKMVEKDKAAGLIPFYVRKDKIKLNHTKKCTNTSNIICCTSSAISGLLLQLKTTHTHFQTIIEFTCACCCAHPEAPVKGNIVSVGPNVCLSG